MRERLVPVSYTHLDVHLMIEEPIRYIEDFVKAGADIITVHVEACKDVVATLEKIKECGYGHVVSSFSERMETKFFEI